MKTSSIFTALLITTGLLAAACVAEPDVAIDNDSTEEVGEVEQAPAGATRAWTAAGTEASRHGIRLYALEQSGESAEVLLAEEDQRLVGSLRSSTPEPGLVRLELSWDGRDRIFEVDTRVDPSPLTITAGAEKETVFQTREGKEQGSASAQALLARVTPEWELAKAIFTDLKLDRPALTGIQQRENVPRPDDFEMSMSSIAAPDLSSAGSCPAVCYKNGCYWLWNQYCHYYPGGDGYCYLSLCGCGC
jgi:hypothetical protein